MTRMETAIDGYQGGRGDLTDRDHVLATAKHYAGDGDTEYGTAVGDYKIDQGIAITNRRDFWDVSLRQYLPAVRDHRVGSVMPSFSSVDWTEDGVGNPIKMHANRELITDVLKGSMRFGGLVISDWEGIHQIPGDWPTQVRTGVNAGIDMMMEPNQYQSFITTLIDEVNAGRVPMSRIDDAVSRILTKKFELGLFEKPFTDRRNQDEIGSRAHHRVAREAAAKSSVLLKNKHRTLPRRLSRRRVRGGLERGQHREPGRRLDDHVAGQLEPRDSGHDDPGRNPRALARPRDPQPGRLGADKAERHRHRGCRRDAVLRGVRRRGRTTVGL